MIISQIESIYSDSITLFDRGFPSYELMFLMMIQETHRRFVIRCKTSFNKEVIAFVNSNENSKIIELKPTNYAVPGLLEKGFKITTQTAIKVRMVKIILSSGEIEILLTSLYCQ